METYNKSCNQSKMNGSTNPINPWINLNLISFFKMAGAKEWKTQDDDSILDEFCNICATVTIGLESLCAIECEQKLACNVTPGRGRIYFTIPRKRLREIQQLRSVENLFVVVEDIADFKLSVQENVEIILQRLYHLPEQLNLKPAFDIWKEYKDLCTGGKTKALQHIEISANESSTGENITTEVTLPRFRVTCTRNHSNSDLKHAFTSMQAAAKFGGGINDTYGWTVDLEDYDIDILLNIVDNHVVVGISLTEKSLFRRNIVNFGPTTLKSTLAYCMALAAEICEGKNCCNLCKSVSSIS